MSKNLDSNIQQKALFYNIDTIYNEIVTNRLLGPSLTPKKFNNVKFFHKDPPSPSGGAIQTPRTYNKEESINLLTRQSSILGNNAIPTAGSALGLFADKQSDTGINPDLEYNFIHALIFTETEQDQTDPNKFQTKFWICDIDEINKQVNQEPKPRFMFNKIEIINKSKEAFTLRSNYQVVFNIAFNYFEDLKEEIITLKNLRNLNETKKIPLLKLIYPLYNFNTKDKLTHKAKEARTGSGLILVQSLAYGQGEFFKNFYEDIGGLPLLTKLHHLTFHKHEFDVFKSNNASFIPFENELTIYFISYEAAEQPSLEKHSESIGNINENIYYLLKEPIPGIAFSKYTTQLGRMQINKRTGNKEVDLNAKRVIHNANDSPFDAFIASLDAYNKSIEALEIAVECVEQNRPIPNYTKVWNIVGELEKKYTGAAFVKEAKNAIVDFRDASLSIKTRLNMNMVYYLLKNMTTYSVPIKQDLLIEYYSADFFDSFIKVFADNFTGATLTGAFIGGGLNALGATAVSTPVGALVAGIGLGGYAAYKGATASGDVYEKNIYRLRENFKTAIRQIKVNSSLPSFVPSPQDIYYDASTGINLFGNETRPFLRGQGGVTSGQTTGGLIGNTETEKTRVLDQIKKAVDIEINDQTIQTDFDLHFLFFGQIVDYVMSVTKNCDMLMGGRNFPYDASGKSYFINYYWTPISLAAYSDFLKRKFLDSSSYQYSVEAFLKDLVEELLKNSLATNGIVNEFFKEAVPSTIRFQSITQMKKFKTDKEKSTTAALAEEDMLDDQKFLDVKQDLVLSSTVTSDYYGTKKLYCVLAEQNLRFYDFYASSKSKNPPYQVDQNPQRFQERIIKEHLFPCIRIKSTDTSGSILKNKNLTFRRMDNANLMLGTIIDSSPAFRLPYEVTGELKAYLTFFFDVGNLFFISPPEGRKGNLNLTDTFGFAGLYIVKGCSFSYIFQNSNGGKISLPNLDSKVIFSGYLISYGDGYKPTSQTEVAVNRKDICNDIPTFVAN